MMLTTARRRKPTIGPCSAFTRNSAIPRSWARAARGCGRSADAAPRSAGARGRVRRRAGRRRPRPPAPPRGGPPGARAAAPRRTWLVLAGAVVLTLGLRLPYLHLPLGV